MNKRWLVREDQRHEPLLEAPPISRSIVSFNERADDVSFDLRCSMIGRSSSAILNELSTENSWYDTHSSIWGLALCDKLNFVGSWLKKAERRHEGVGSGGSRSRSRQVTPSPLSFAPPPYPHELKRVRSWLHRCPARWLLIWKSAHRDLKILSRHISNWPNRTFKLNLKKTLYY